MRSLFLAALASAALAGAGAPAVTVGFGAGIGGATQTRVVPVQYDGGGHCRRTCVTRDSYGRCTYYRRVCH